MSLSDRLGSADPRRPNRGCETCFWLAELEHKDQEAFKDWIKAGFSLRQLHFICTTDKEHPLNISLTAMKNHIRDCWGLR